MVPLPTPDAQAAGSDSASPQESPAPVAPRAPAARAPAKKSPPASPARAARGAAPPAAWRSRAAQILNRLRSSTQTLDDLLAEPAPQSRGDEGAAEVRSGAVLKRVLGHAVGWRATFAQIVKCFASVPLGHIEEHVRTVLDLALAELLVEGTRPAAAINEAVALAAGSAKRRGFVNGLLRAIAREAEPVTAAALGDDPAGWPRNVFRCSPERAWRFARPLFADPAKKPAAYLAAACSLPRWLVDRWLERFGIAQTAALAEAANARPPLTARVNTRRTTPAALIDAMRAAGHEVSQPDPAFPEALHFPARPALTETPWFASGQLYIQDLAAIQVVGRVLRGITPGARVLDACAAPGGKLGHIVERLDGAGTFVAIEVSRARLARLRDNLARLGHAEVEVVGGQSGALLSEYAARSPAPEPFDLVLVDAPCSNTGVLARRADVRWRLAPDTPERMRETQGALLAEAAGLVRAGGVLAYSTCTLEAEENLEVVRAFLDRHPGWTLIEARATWPVAGRQDGSFVARLSRPAADAGP